MGRVLVTGGHGFLGAGLVSYLRGQGMLVQLAVRHASEAQGEVFVGEIHRETNWRAALKGVDTVIHLAARVHVMQDLQPHLYEVVNTAGTIALAKAAQESGVRRFIYLSSIKVHGEETLHGQAWCAMDALQPEGAYAVSKYAAEQYLQTLQAMEVVILRPPLIYGPGVKANLYRLLQAVDRCPVLPFGALTAHRSLMSLSNIVHLIHHCITNSNAPANIFLMEDNKGQSTTMLIQDIADAMKKRCYLAPVPISLLELGAKSIGRLDTMRRLTRPLMVDMTETMTCLDWVPPVPYRDAIAEMVDWYQRQKYR